jgi:hypothetical protein
MFGIPGDAITIAVLVVVGFGSPIAGYIGHVIRRRCVGGRLLLVIAFYAGLVHHWMHDKYYIYVSPYAVIGPILGIVVFAAPLYPRPRLK